MGAGGPGTLGVGGTALAEGDGWSTQEAGSITLTADDESEFLLFDLA